MTDDSIVIVLQVLLALAFVIVLVEAIIYGPKRQQQQEQLADQLLGDGQVKSNKQAYITAIKSLKPPLWMLLGRMAFIPALIVLVAYQILISEASLDFPLLLVLSVFAAALLSIIDFALLAIRRQRLVSKVAALLSVDPKKKLSKQAEQELSGDEMMSYKVLVAAGSQLSSVETSKSFFPVLFLVLVLRSFLVEPFQIPSTSMVPTLEVGDFILVNKFAYGIRLPVINKKVIEIGDPQRGDVMVFFPPNEKRYFIKRVIGLPGDKIDYINNELFINSEKVPEEFQARVSGKTESGEVVSLELYQENLAGVSHRIQKIVDRYGLAVSPNDNTSRSYTVPEGHYFMMGDNRNNSSDSREWGTVPEENIVGKAFVVWMHLGSSSLSSRVGAIR